jgi:hypothetical protein
MVVVDPAEASWETERQEKFASCPEAGIVRYLGQVDCLENLLSACPSWECDREIVEEREYTIGQTVKTTGRRW